MDRAFRKIHELLCLHIVLFVPVTSDSFVLYTDASGGGVVACLHVSREGEEQHVALFSHQLRGAELNLQRN